MKSFFYKGEDRHLIKVLCDNFSDFSYSYIQKIIRKGDVKINGKRVKEDIIIHKNDEIIVYCQEKSFCPTIIYEDEVIVVFLKFKGISSEDFAQKVNTAIQGLILCHRLDTNTEGLLLFAKNQSVFEEIKNAFSNHKIEKHYIAETVGCISRDTVLQDYLLKNSAENRVYIYSKPVAGALPITTKVSVLRQKEMSTIVDIELVTGRTHQIRAHLAYYGYPLVGDGKYGNEKMNKLFKEHTQRLLAYKMTFHTKDLPLLSHLDKQSIFIQNPQF